MIGHRCPQRAFTLVELMAVTVVLSLAVGMVAVSLNGVTRKGRLTTAMRQVASFDQAARVQALAEGILRSVEFKRDSNRIRTRKLETAEGKWRWTTGSTLRLTAGPRIKKVVFPERVNSGDSNSLWKIRINSDGASASYGVVFGGMGDAKSLPAIVIEGISGESRTVWDANEIESALESMKHGDCPESRP